MACFTAPLVESAVVHVVEKHEAKKEAAAKERHTKDVGSIPLSTKLGWLKKLLWGGSFLLAFEHVWHGEITPWFPFLTAMADPGEAAQMFREIATSGVAMAVLITLVWLAMCKVADNLTERAEHAVKGEA